MPIGPDMDMRHDNSFRSNSAYQGRIAEEETKIRWLIIRQPRSRELAYNLIFLLTANERYASAIEECRRVLETYPGDVIARMWRELIHLRWRRSPCRLISNRHFDRDQRWRRIPRHAG
jgi:Flp pilus assembly protein TadD